MRWREHKPNQQQIVATELEGIFEGRGRHRIATIELAHHLKHKLHLDDKIDSLTRVLNKLMEGQRELMKYRGCSY